MNRRRTNGFTLIEVIVAIVLSAIALAAILPMLDKVFLLSHEPRTTLQAGLNLQSAIEELVAWDAAHSNTPALVQAHVGSVGGTFMGQTVAFNGFTAFSGGSEVAPTTNNLLKITLRNPLGETVTRLFAVPP